MRLRRGFKVDSYSLVTRITKKQLRQMKQKTRIENVIISCLDFCLKIPSMEKRWNFVSTFLKYLRRAETPNPMRKLNICPAKIPVTARISKPCKAIALSTNRSTQLFDIPRIVMPMMRSLNPVIAWRKLSISIISLTTNYNHSIPAAIEKTRNNLVFRHQSKGNLPISAKLSRF